MKKVYLLAICLTLGVSSLFSQKKEIQPPLSFKNGSLTYSADSLGNQIPDFSHAGYMGGDISIPLIPARAVVLPPVGDATQIIQQAIDYIATLPAEKAGFRGAILLKDGEYRVSGNLNLPASGIVLRGSGVGKTRIIATGKDRRTLIKIVGQQDREEKASIKITDNYVPVNASTVTLPAGHGLKAGDGIIIERPSTKGWIEALGTEHFGGGITALGWKPNEQNIRWYRTVISADGNQVTFDAPITTALDIKYGGGIVIPYSWKGRIENIGIENLTCISEYDTTNPKDEAHSWCAITVENSRDVWVRNINFENFAGSAVAILESSSRVTVENCKSLNPVSEIGGWRRNTFYTSGGQCLFQRIYAEGGYHDFAVGFCAPGPNAFVQCHSMLPYSFSGGVESWASGVLFDIVNVEGNALSYKNLGYREQGAGWNAANSVFWQCSASLIECFAPPTAMNWAFGSWSEFSGNGLWFDSNNSIKPRSLYYQQLSERLNDRYYGNSNLLPVETDASSSPSIEDAAKLTKLAYKPALTLAQWIDSITSQIPVEVPPASAKIFTQKNNVSEAAKINYPALKVTNGWIARGDVVQTGGKHDIRWWSGTVEPAYLAKSASPHLTRFVPMRTGVGLTDDVKSVAQWMKHENIVAIDHNYGLWYDRRRDDHERIRRIDGDVCPPFYEQPFARSGQGTAYDGLSKYDLTKYNSWYWMRLRQFADEADANSLVLLHQNYFQHNIIEAGAHWADSPWRPANNINNTGFPEPAPYAGDKRIFVAEQFYDTTNVVRKELNRAYIRQCLNNFRGTGSVIQLISTEFTGPLHFVEFWLDVIAQWEAETGERQLIALSTTKDVQDSILNDPIRSKIVDIIDIRYWFQRGDGTFYAPLGGQNLAPRQHARLTKPGSVTFESVYRAIDQYKTAYPEKAVTYYSEAYPQQAWAVFMAQGSLAAIPRVDNPDFLKAASTMHAMKNLNKTGQYVLGNPNKGFVVYCENSEVELDLSQAPGRYDIYYIDPKTGATLKSKQSVNGGIMVKISASKKIVWLFKK